MGVGRSMSGHSKWSQIKRQKGAADQKRGAVFTKLAGNITLAAREGGGDVNMNFKLRLAVDKAKAVNMPKDNIERAIKRGTGELGGGPIDEVRYEGFGPSGVVIIVDALTDNKNRTVANIKHMFSKYGGNLGGPGSVAWMFQKKGVIRVANEDLKISEEDLELKAIDAGAEDFVKEDDGLVIYTAPDDFQAVKEMLEKEGIILASDEIEFVAKERVEITEASRESLDRLYEEFEEDQDIVNYYTNEA